VLQKAAPFSVKQLMGVDAQIFHLGPLLADDFSPSAIRAIAEKGKISLDVQGFLRRVEATHVMPGDWKEKIAVLPVIHFLKASEEEMEVLTGCTDVFEGARVLFGWGTREVIITGGSKGSVIFDGVDYTIIPAYQPQQEIDATGCCDTYMAGYLFQRSSGASIQQAGEFAAAMAALKIEKAGPFRGTIDDVNAVVKAGQRIRSRFIGV
jgi:sugar/nucleoside kinase (ribokinase family)